MTTDHSNESKASLIRITLTAGAVAGAISSVLALRTYIFPPKGPAADIKIVSAEVTEDGGAVADLDVKVQNLGARTTILHRAQFKVQRSWVLRSFKSGGGPLTSSTTYQDVTLSAARQVPYLESKGISQAERPDEPDRFTFKIGLSPDSAPHEAVIFLLTVALVFDDTNRMVTSEPLILILNGSNPLNFSIAEAVPDQKDLAMQNRARVLDVAKVNGARSRQVSRFVEYFRDHA